MKTQSFTALCVASSHRQSTIAFAVALSSLFASLSVHAVDVTWSGDTADINTDTNWVGGALPSATLDRWVFGAAGAGGSELTGSRNFAGMLFNAGAPAYTIGTLGDNSTWQVTSSAITNNSSNIQTINYNLAIGTARIFTGSTAGGDIVVNGNLSGGENATKNGTNNLTITSAGSTLTNNFTVNGGRLVFGAVGTVGAKVVGASGARVFNINNGGTLAAAPGVTLTANSSIQNLVMRTGSSFTMADGFFNTFEVTGTADLFQTTGTEPVYNFNVGDTASADVLALTNAPTFSIAGPRINITPVTALIIGNTYTVVTAPSGLDSANGFVLGTGLATFGNTTYTLSITNTATTTIIGVTSANLAKAFYSGSQGTTLNAGTPGVSSNWLDAASGGTDTLFQPTTATEMHFAATGATNTTIATLGQDYTVVSLNFNDNAGPVSINDTGSNTITVGTGGINVAAESHSINVPLVLSTSATFANSGAGFLTIGGSIDSNGNTLTAGGTGSITIDGNVTNSGGVIKEGAGTATFAGTISGSGGITKNGTGVLVLNGANNHSGATAINQGTISVSSFAAFGTDTGPISMGVSGAAGITYTGTGETTTRNFATSGLLANSATFTQAGTGLLKLAGDFTVATANNRNLILDGSTEGTGEISGVISNNSVGLRTQIIKNGTGTWTLSGLNTYSNNTTVNSGTLIIAPTGQLTFRTTETSGAGNNVLTGAGNITLDGSFVIDTSATDASALTSGSWVIENAISLPGAYGDSFSLVGWNDEGNETWTTTVDAKNYIFDETTGTVTMSVSDPYPAWIGSFTPNPLLPDEASKLPGADPDGDGIGNLLEFVLTGSPVDSSQSINPTLTTVGDNQVLSYKRSDESESTAITQIGQWSTDLAIWTGVTPVEVNENGALPDDMTITVPNSNEVAGKLFLRLKVMK